MISDKMASKQQLACGYDCKFVEEPAKELQTECSVCLHVLCKPDMVSCCGEKFCHSCIEQVIKKKTPCPHCGSTQFDTMTDKKLERELNALKVYCTNENEGCRWVGELRDLEKHRNSVNKSTFADIKKGCEYEKILCSKCKREVQRSLFGDHLSKGCRVPDGECQFNFAGCKAKVSVKDMKQHLEENMAVHLSLITDLTRNLSSENARSRELLARLSTEAEDRQVQLQHHDRGEVVQQVAGEAFVRQPPQRRHRGRSISLWVGGALVMVLLSVFIGQNKDTVINIVGDFMTLRGINQDRDIMFDHSEITLALTDLESKVNTMERDMNTLKRSVNDNLNKIQVTVEDVRKLGKETEGWSTVSKNVENLKSQIPVSDDLEKKLDDLSNDVSNLAQTIKNFVNKEDLQMLRQRLDTLAGLQRELDSLRIKVDSLPRPLTRDEIATLVLAELAAHRPPHPPPHHHHHHGHKHGGCRGHH